MKLIVENDFNDFDLIIEQENPNAHKFIRVKGPYIVTEQKNANGRVYDKGLMEKCVEEWRKTCVNQGRALGEMNHPPHTDIDQERACHRVTDITQDGKIWIGESVVLTSSPDGSIKGTPMGDILASILQHGGKPGMSTRGVGEISESGRIDKDYKLITVDCVANPSGPGCFVNGILESKEFVVDTYGDIIEKHFEKFENGLKNIPTHSTHTDLGKAYVSSLIENFIENMKKGV